jgi:CHAP domain
LAGVNPGFKRKSGQPHGHRMLFRPWFSNALTCAATTLLLFVCVPHASRAWDRGPQCVPFARALSSIRLFGDARGWWSAAAGSYNRGTRPQVGSVLSFRSDVRMPLGHVAVVTTVVDRREIRSIMRIGHRVLSVGRCEFSMSLPRTIGRRSASSYPNTTISARSMQLTDSFIRGRSSLDHRSSRFRRRSELSRKTSYSTPLEAFRSS